MKLRRVGYEHRYTAFDLRDNILNTVKVLSAVGKEENAALLTSNAISTAKKASEHQRRGGRAKNHLEPYKPIKPKEMLPGEHSTFRRNPLTENVNHYATWTHQTNLRDPSPWKMV